MESIGKPQLNNISKDSNNPWTKPKDNICRAWHNSILTIVFKDQLKDSNVENAKNKHLKDVLNVKVFGIAQDNVKQAIGLNIKQNAMQKQNN